MRRLLLIVILALVAEAPGLAQTMQQRNAWRDKAESDAKDAAARQAKEAALQARSLNGLIITHFSYDGNGWGQVVVQNISASPAVFDYHQVRGVELDTGTITQAADIKFRTQEIANREVKPGVKRGFKVFFFGGRKIAAVAWHEKPEWRVNEKTVAESSGKAVELAQKIAADRRLAERKRALVPVEQGKIVVGK